MHMLRQIASFSAWLQQRMVLRKMPIRTKAQLASCGAEHISIHWEPLSLLKNKAFKMSVMVAALVQSRCRLRGSFLRILRWAIP